MQLTTQEAERIFRKLKVEMKPCKHHIAGFVTLDGVRILPVHYSYGRKDLPGNVPDKFRKSLHLNLEEFEQLKSCVMSRDQFIDVLIAKGVIN